MIGSAKSQIFLRSSDKLFWRCGCVATPRPGLKCGTGNPKNKKYLKKRSKI